MVEVVLEDEDDEDDGGGGGVGRAAGPRISRHSWQGRTHTHTSHTHCTSCTSYTHKLRKWCSKKYTFILDTHTYDQSDVLKS